MKGVFIGELSPIQQFIVLRASCIHIGNNNLIYCKEKDYGVYIGNNYDGIIRFLSPNLRYSGPLFIDGNNIVYSNVINKKGMNNIEDFKISDSSFIKLNIIKFDLDKFKTNKQVGCIPDELNIKDLDFLLIKDYMGVICGIDYNSLFALGLKKTIELIKRINFLESENIQIKNKLQILEKNFEDFFHLNK